MKRLILTFLLISSFCSADIVQVGNIQTKGLSYNNHQTPRILPFGASNTGGQSSGPAGRLFAYRRGLQQTLGVGTYDIVGDFTDPDSDATYDVDHSGVGGQTTATLEARLLTTINTYLPGCGADDVIILDTGTNDSCLDSVPDREGARDNFEDMIEIASTACPTSKIIAISAGPIKTANSSCIDAPAFADVSAYHDLVTAMIATEQTTNANLYYADLYEYMETDAPCGGGNADACLYDNAHWTETGYTLNGNKIADCITNPGSTTYCFSP